MKIGTDRLDVRILSSANSVSVALYGSASFTPNRGQKTSMASELLPEPWVPQMNSVGNEPTRSMKRGFIGVANHQPMAGTITSGRLSRGRCSKTARATVRNVASSQAT